MMVLLSKIRFFFSSAVFFLVACGCFLSGAQELQLSDADKKQMDPFEAHSLGLADKCFNQGQYRTAAAGYDSFVLEFPQSRVLAYAVFRKARSIDLDNKRYEAVKGYNEVLDYFPNDVHYAAAALYYMGACYMQVGDPENAMKVWLKMVRDKEYRKHYLAAGALNMLAENYVKQSDFERAMVQYEQVVEDFRTANTNASWAAMWKVIEYRTKTKPDEPKLRVFYVKAKGFDKQPSGKIPSDLADYQPYWTSVRQQVRQYGAEFGKLQAEQRAEFYKYWTSVMQGKMPADDDFQIDLADFAFVYENDPKKRAERLDAQFAKYQKPGDNSRIIKWMGLFPGRKDKLEEYYAKLDLAKLDYAVTERLVFTLIGLGERQMAANAFEKLSFRELNDGARAGLMRRLWQPVRDGFPISSLQKIANSFGEQDAGQVELLRFYHWAHNMKEGIPTAEKLTSAPRFSSEAYYKLGDLQMWSKQYEKAIISYQQANSPPSTSFQIAECYRLLGRLEKAIETLTEIENFFPKEAPRAALTKANLYKQAGIREKRVAALRAVMKKYPGSPQARTAHEDLEELGVLMGGGVDAE